MGLYRNLTILKKVNLITVYEHTLIIYIIYFYVRIILVLCILYFVLVVPENIHTPPQREVH